MGVTYSLSVQDLFTDLEDGVLLTRLLEILSGEKLSPVGEDNGGGHGGVCVCVVCVRVCMWCACLHMPGSTKMYGVWCVCACVCMCACVHHACVYVSSHAWQHQNI